MPNVRQVSARELNLNRLPSDFTPNYIPAKFNSRQYWLAHKYLAGSFEHKVRFGLLEFCQVSQILSTIIMMPFANMFSDLENIDLYFYTKFQRGYLFLNKSLDELKKLIVKELKKQVDENKIEPSRAEQQIDNIFDFMTLDSAKQKMISLWSFGPRFIFIQYGENYFCDYSAWFAIFRNLFFGLREYDPRSNKGKEFESVFANTLREKSFDVVMESKRIKSKKNEREIDVAVRINNKLYLFECVAAELPLDFSIGKPKTIKKRIDRLQEKLDQVNSLVGFIESNKKGDGYDFSWAKEVRGIVVSPYIEWIWSENRSYWTDVEGFPMVMSVNEAVDYLTRFLPSG